MSATSNEHSNVHTETHHLGHHRKCVTVTRGEVGPVVQTVLHYTHQGWKIAKKKKKKKEREIKPRAGGNRGSRLRVPQMSAIHEVEADYCLYLHFWRRHSMSGVRRSMIEIDTCLAAQLHPPSLTTVSCNPPQTRIMSTGRCDQCDTMVEPRELKQCANCR